jgi:hypothetical protein
MGIRHIAAFAVAVPLLVAAPARAELPMRDALIDGARMCTQQFPIQERTQNIPTHLLAAISSTETGRWHKQLDMALPWPWTVNVEGKGYYFASKAEAVAKTQAFINQGKRSIDVGCMQVNLKHHNTAFRTLNEAFEPSANVAYAAKFLRTNYNDLGDWIKATAAYHSRTPKYGNAYLARIEKNWTRIVSKVQQARANQGLGPQATATPNFAAAQQQAAAAPRAMNRIDSTRNVRVIQVSDARRSAEVMVVRPQTATSTMRVADAAAAPNAGVTRIGVDSAAPAANSAAKPSGPKFVFAN